MMTKQKINTKRTMELFKLLERRRGASPYPFHPYVMPPSPADISGDNKGQTQSRGAFQIIILECLRLTNCKQFLQRERNSFTISSHNIPTQQDHSHCQFTSHVHRQNQEQFIDKKVSWNSKTLDRQIYKNKYRESIVRK